MSTARKVIVLPFCKGQVNFITDDYLTIGEVVVIRSSIVGRQPERGENVIAIDLADLLSALRAADNELVEVEVNCQVARLTAKAAYLDVPIVGMTMIPLRYFAEQPEVLDFIRTVRIPLRIADDLGL